MSTFFTAILKFIGTHVVKRIGTSASWAGKMLVNNDFSFDSILKVLYDRMKELKDHHASNPEGDLGFVGDVQECVALLHKIVDNLYMKSLDRLFKGKKVEVKGEDVIFTPELSVKEMEKLNRIMQRLTHERTKDVERVFEILKTNTQVWKIK